MVGAVAFMRRPSLYWGWFLGFCCFLGGQGWAASEPARLRVYYLGNSLTALTHPAWQGELGAEAGVVWEAGAFLGAGWASWMHLHEIERALGLRPGQPGLPSGPSGSLTLRKDEATPPHVGAVRFLEQPWDAVVIQIFGASLEGTVREARGVAFDPPVTSGDVPAIVGLIRHYLERTPRGRVFIYSVWPIMPEGEPRLVDGKIVRGAEFPLRDQFDYDRAWTLPYPTTPAEARRAGTRPHRTKAYKDAVIAEVARHFPELVGEQRLREIPGGDLLAALDAVAKAGGLPGISSAKDLYTDVQHLRSGLGHYAMAALFYASLFEADPSRLPYGRFNDQAAYGVDVANDFGAVIPVTPERAAVLHRAIRQTLAARAR